MSDEKNADTTAKEGAALEWRRKNRWNEVSAEEHERVEEYCRSYLNFISEAKTEREAHDRALALAQEQGYGSFDGLDTSSRLTCGDKVYRSYRGKTLLLARIGRRPLTEGMHILGGHTDAPRLDTKPNPLYEDSELALLDTHYYGGIKKYQWVTMPLALHGIVVKQDGTSVAVNIGEERDDPVLVVTDLLPHLDKDQAQKTMEKAIPGENLDVLAGSMPASEDAEGAEKKDGKKVKHHILKLLYDKYGITEEDFASAELEIVPAGPGRELGLDRSMMLAYAHDDRVSAYASLEALLSLEQDPEYTAVVLLCDREEIGSKGATGMDSVFFENTIAELLNCTEGEVSLDLSLRRALEKSRMISADVSMLHDPNYPDVSSPNNTGLMNAGILLSKYTGARGKSGCSEASAEFMAELRRIFNNNTVFWQTGELGKVDQGGGGTISMYLARYGMDVVDCGAGVLSMHAPWEVVGKLDAYMAYKAYRCFLEHQHNLNDQDKA